VNDGLEVPTVEGSAKEFTTSVQVSKH
jgi:hypothetical protein